MNTTMGLRVHSHTSDLVRIASNPRKGSCSKQIAPVSTSVEDNGFRIMVEGKRLDSFNQWTSGRVLSSLGTNAGAMELPFQGWRNFKEAFAPELVAQAVAESRIPVTTCLDPFGGSGTTALAAQFLGISPITIEVNPFLADLIEAKLTQYNADLVARDLGAVVRDAIGMGTESLPFRTAPATFLEPGIRGRWIFDRAVGARIGSLLNAIEQLSNEKHRRLFKVLTGGILTSVSNVVVSGKGRRYRSRWLDRRCEPLKVVSAFSDSAIQAVLEIHQFSERPCSNFRILRGDCRSRLKSVEWCDLAVFSPPYPNSFDYTDVYNIELWTLGYLRNQRSNSQLRASTLNSHVQIKRAFPAAPLGSRTLNRTLVGLEHVRAKLWNRWIPDMIGGYFADLVRVLEGIHRLLSKRGSVWIVLGDSRYAGIQVKTASIVSELARQIGYRVDGMTAFRSMRASPQQGGRHELPEILLRLWKP